MAAKQFRSNILIVRRVCRIFGPESPVARSIAFAALRRINAAARNTADSFSASQFGARHQVAETRIGDFRFAEIDEPVEKGRATNFIVANF